MAAPSHPDPYPWYGTLRAMRPLFFDERLGLWVASSAAVVQEALLHPGLRVRPPAEPVPRALVGTAAGEVFSLLVRMNDGAFHARHKPAVSADASRFDEEAARSAASAAVDDLVEHAAPDFLLSAVPVQAMARLLGVPRDALARTVGWVHDFTRGIAPGADAAAVSAADAAARALMAQGEAAGLSRAAAANRLALMQQALDATAGLIGNTLVLLERHPQLANEPHFVAEVARWDPPVHNTRRFAAEDTVLAGEPIHAGQGVLLLVAAANRDPALNEDPDAFLCARPARRSLVFGGGAHACPGERLALALAEGAVRALRRRGPLQRVLGSPRGYRPLTNARIPVFSPPEELA